MRVLHIAPSYGTSGGAALGAMRLHRALIAQGVESYFACQTCAVKEKHVIVFPPEGSLHRWLHTRLSKLSRNIWRFVPPWRKVELAIVPSGIGRIVRQIEPDVIHVHGAGSDTIRLEELMALKKPIVIMLHDLWSINGIDPCPLADRRYIEGFTSANSSWVERWLWGRKNRVFSKSNVTFVGPSEWVVASCRKSLIGRDKKAFAISNLIGDEFSWREELLERHQKFTVLFGCDGSRTNPYKGFSDLESALLKLPVEVQRETRLVIFGDSSPDFKVGEVNARCVGYVKSVGNLVRLYHQADILAFPSVTETQGMVKVEAMLCGLPVVVFNRTACAEGVEHKVMGWVAPDADSDDFSRGLLYYYGMFKCDKVRAQRPLIAERSHKLYGDATLTDRWKSLYAELVKM